MGLALTGSGLEFSEVAQQASGLKFFEVAQRQPCQVL